jgi:hypothetical protein
MLTACFAGLVFVVTMSHHHKETPTQQNTQSASSTTCAGDPIAVAAAPASHWLNQDNMVPSAKAPAASFQSNLLALYRLLAAERSVPATLLQDACELECKQAP